MKLILELWDDQHDRLAGQDALHVPNDLADAFAGGGRHAWPATSPGWIGHLGPEDGAPFRFHIRWRFEPCRCLSCQATAAPPEPAGRRRHRRP
jgi:hypothetical protein